MIELESWLWSIPLICFPLVRNDFLRFCWSFPSDTRLVCYSLGTNKNLTLSVVHIFEPFLNEELGRNIRQAHRQNYRLLAIQVCGCRFYSEKFNSNYLLSTQILISMSTTFIQLMTRLTAILISISMTFGTILGHKH